MSLISIFKKEGCSIKGVQLLQGRDWRVWKQYTMKGVHPRQPFSRGESYSDTVDEKMLTEADDLDRLEAKLERESFRFTEGVVKEAKEFS